MHYDADTARTNRSGGFACEVFLEDGSVDGVGIATAYGPTAEAAEANARQIAEAMNATAGSSALDPDLADDGTQAWVDFIKERDMSIYTPAALIYALERQAEWGQDWKAEAERCHNLLIGFVDQGFLSEAAVNRHMGEGFVEGAKSLRDLLGNQS